MTLGSQNLNTSSPPVRQPQESLTPLASILVVEDEAGVRNLMVQLLQMGGYAAIAVDNGRNGLFRVSKQTITAWFSQIFAWREFQARKLQEP
jgi:response regulator RpfG family c-di-GMP phosphodiesterase